MLDISAVTLTCNMYALLGDISAEISATPLGDRYLLSTYIWTYKSPRILVADHEGQAQNSPKG